jgi:transposase
METTRVTKQYSAAERRLYMALELSASKWLVLFSAGGVRTRRVSVEAGDLARMQREIAVAKAKFGLEANAAVCSCYEAGRDGFWIHRWLLSIGVDNRVIDSASIEVTQRSKRVKTDRVDVQKLLKLLVRVINGEPDAWHELRVPSVQHEDQRRLHRERERLHKERTALGNRIGSLLATQGLRLAPGREFEHRLQQLRCWDGQPLPAHLVAEIVRMWRRCQLLDEQLHAVQRERQQLMTSQTADAPMQQLMRLRSLGLQTSWLLGAEVFAWREIANRRQLGALAGLTPTPYASGGSEREQGITGGNRRVRTCMVELAWMWLRLQPGSELAQWFQRRFAIGGKRSRRIGIVALARKLLVALWRFLRDGLIPAGATLKAA